MTADLLLDQIRLRLPERRPLAPSQVDAAHPLPFPLRSTVTIHMAMPGLKLGKHEIEVEFEARPFGRLHLKVQDAVQDGAALRARFPRDEADDYNLEIIGKRRTFIERRTRVQLNHFLHHSFDPHLPRGN